MSRPYVVPASLAKFRLWDRQEAQRRPFSFEWEVTARCNNDCVHCFINLPAADREARARELSLEESLRIAREAVSLGALWCLVTGGEPLLRQDFFDLYLGLKRLGLLVSVFTNVCLVSPEHVKLFKHYPPRDLEVSVYGVTRETYEAVTRKPGSFAAFQRGLDLLLSGGVKVHLKSMALKANLHELPAIARFCRVHTKNYFRFDPLLHLRYDGDAARNREIMAQRLSPEEIAALEQADPERWNALKKQCTSGLGSRGDSPAGDQLFRCGVARDSFVVSPEGIFRLCSSLWHEDCLFDLRQGRLEEAWGCLGSLVSRVHSTNREFLEKCRECSLHDLCLWCPAHAHLETGRLDAWVEYFCRVARARGRALGLREQKRGSSSLG